MTTFGPAYDEAQDGSRLKKQHEAIRTLMMDGHWRTLSEISERLGYPEASVSAQLRHLRKERFGSYQVEKRRRPEGAGTWEYRVSKPEPEQIPLKIAPNLPYTGSGDTLTCACGCLNVLPPSSHKKRFLNDEHRLWFWNKIQKEARQKVLRS